MNNTMNRTTITVSVTKAANKNAIKKHTVYDYRGRARVVEKVKGITI